MSESTEAAAVPAAVPAQPEQSTMDNVRAGAADLAEQATEKARQAGEVISEVADRAVDATRDVVTQAARRLRNNAELPADRGRTTIRHEVVEKIAGIAARGVPGVHDLGGDVARVFAGLKERVGLGDADDDTDRGVSVRLDGEQATVEITLVIEYGQVVRTVTEAVRAEVIAAVERMLSLQVTEVNIRVDDVHVKAEA